MNYDAGEIRFVERIAKKGVQRARKGWEKIVTAPEFRASSKDPFFDRNVR